MKVILLKDIKNLGGKYEVVNITPGYARNFLFPKKLAKPATNQSLKELSARIRAFQREKEAKKEKIIQLIKKISGLELGFKEKTNKKGGLFGSIDRKKIKQEIEKRFDIKDFEVELPEPIKKTGEYPVKIGFPFNLEAEIKIKVEKNKADEDQE